MSIVIPELPRLHHDGDIYRDGWISLMICGKSGCGKTSLMARLVPSISDRIKFICIATMVYRNPFHLAVKEWADKNKRICVINNVPELIRAFVTELHTQGWLIPGEQEMLMIFDDYSINNRSGSRPENLVVEAFTRWRNLGVNFFIVCQDASMVATSCRNCTTMRILFNSASKMALHTFNKDIVDRVPDREAYENLVKYIMSVPYSYIMVREGPLDISIGKGDHIRQVMTETSVIVPTYKELMEEMGVGTPQELGEEASRIQKSMGNDAPQLDGKRVSRRFWHFGTIEEQKESSDNDSDDSDDSLESFTEDNPL